MLLAAVFLVASGGLLIGKHSVLQEDSQKKSICIAAHRMNSKRMHAYCACLIRILHLAGMVTWHEISSRLPDKQPVQACTGRRFS